MNLSPDLRANYQSLWLLAQLDTDDITPDATRRINAAADMVRSHRDHYTRIESQTGVPWVYVGCVHYREGDCNFLTHLHNGDSLKRRTFHVPAGRPVAGEPPFLWDDSALDCIRYEGLDHWRDWSTAGMLYQLELINGFGYRRFHPEVKSPYLWSFTSVEERAGKYDDDGHFNPDMWDSQVGCAAILKTLTDRGAYAF